MPIHLPPLSRRRFLARTLALGAGLALGPDAWAAKKRDPNVWALFADTHIAADRAQIGRGIKMADHLAGVVPQVIAAAPAGVFVAGDCAYNSGETADYATLATLLEPLREAQIP